MDISKYKNKIIKAIEYHLPSAKIYLFGSYATGKAKVSSDIDIAIDDEKRISLTTRGQLLNTIDNLNIPFKIDIVDMHAIPEELKNNILKEGIVWKN